MVAPQVAIPARLVLAVAVESGWEVLENSNFIIDRYRAATVSSGYYGDSIFNSVSDILMMILGFYLAMRLPRNWAFFLFFAIEVILAITIRDGLILNLIMLTYPIPAIKIWQTAL